jgi:exodeoxyribonuclease VII large subunit
VVTSPTGAVIRDILHRLEDRCPCHVLVWPVKVQGEGAAEEVAAAVRGFNALAPAPRGSDARRSGSAVPRPDLLIVARGGGSIEDLWAFNEEEVVRAVAGSSIPVISAVGHETDTSLCDFAADMRAPTPTAAAEIAVPVRAELLAQLREYGARIGRCASRARERAAERLATCLRLFPERDALLAPQRQRLDELSERLPRALRTELSQARAHLGQAGGALRPGLLEAVYRRSSERLESMPLRPSLLEKQIRRSRDQLAALWRVAELVHPNKPLERGYARVEDRDGRTLVSAAAARAAGRLGLVFADGRVDASVDGTAGANPGGGVERVRRASYSSAKADQPKLL